MGKIMDVPLQIIINMTEVKIVSLWDLFCLGI
jgi:hypothetical protein